MGSRINFGIIGGSSFAQRSMIPAIQGLKNHFNLIGIASRSGQKAEELSEKFNVPGFASYETLLETEGLQAVYIPLPNSLHFEWIEKCLLKGLHVLVEKSLACSPQEVESLITIAGERGLALMENFQFRFHSQLAYIKSLVADGTIGELRCLRSSFGFPPFKDKDNIRYNASLGGGALLDAGAYPIRITQEFLGTDLLVEASNMSFDDELKVDIWGGGYLKQRSGSLFSEIAFGFDNYYQCNIELWGSKGKVSTNRIFTAPIDFKPTIVLETSDGTKSIIWESDNAYQNMLQYFYTLVAEEEKRERENLSNKVQANLIQQLREKATLTT
ncbi:Gfo/Idh/MocA family protein [Roseivirga misakiensis]|uniref:Uncharacterized protein n=1 Tax=Roseivirga misakiensis TaxID=1563681 RepID=A0A1E5T798_9BACT|nr:Gfo/Idh/MocA family oxidoreductase [Roseivirga misakiensis]OEK07249.1 hypothetical protein BFP71_03700 [Roseivirga misakiensis]